MRKRLDPEKLKVCVVEWMDATADTNDYEDLEDLGDKYVCRRKTVGYFIKEDTDYLVLAEDVTLSPEKHKGDFSGVMSIPKGMIKKRKYLKG